MKIRKARIRICAIILGSIMLISCLFSGAMNTAGNSLSMSLLYSSKNADSIVNINDSSSVSTFTADVQQASSGKLLGVDIDGVYHSQAPLYMNSERKKGEKVVLRLRTLKDNVVQASLVVRVYASLSETVVALEKTDPLDDTGRYDYWKATISPSSDTRQYLFMVRSPGSDTWVYYGVDGLTKDKSLSTSSWFTLSPNESTTPEWSKNAVYYSLLVDSFYNGDTENDPTSTFSAATPILWGTKRNISSEWYGGDFEGLNQKLSYIEDTLGATAIYTNPTFVTNHNAGYGQEDYTTINPYYGSNQEYANLIAAVHNLDMRIINDGVWLYVGADNNRYTNGGGKYPGAVGAFQSEDSPYHDFIDWVLYPTTFRHLYYEYPSVNFDSDFTLDLMIRRPDSALQYFLQDDYGLDGWRLDVPDYGGDVYETDQIIALMQLYMNAISEDKILIGESGSSFALASGAYDTIWYYGSTPLAIRTYLGVTDSTDLWDANGQDGYGIGDMPRSETSMLAFLADRANYLPWQNWASSYMLLSTHDTTRIADALQGDQSSIERAVALQMTLGGSPSIYYGDEIGMTADGFTGYQRMNGFDWDQDDWNMSTFNTYRSLIELRESYSDTYTNGSFIPLVANDNSQVMSYGRFVDSQGAVTVINSSSQTHYVEIPVYKMGVTDGTYVYDWENGYKYKVTNGCIVARVEAGDYAVLVYGGSDVESSYTSDGLKSYDVGATTAYIGRTYGTSDALTITGDGSIGSTQDAFRFVCDEVSGDATVTVKLTGVSSLSSGGSAGLMMRNTSAADSPYFMVGANKSGVAISYRTASGAEAAVESVGGASDTVWLKIERRGNNYTAYSASDNNGQPGGWSALSSQTLFMTEDIEAGAAIAGGVTANLANLAVEKNETVYGDSFDNSVAGDMWSSVPSDGGYYLSNGDLVLSGSNQTVRMLSQAPSNDWSVCSQINGITLAVGDEAGIVSWTTEDEMARVKRVCDSGGRYIVFETESGGTVIERARVEDTNPDAPVYVQLQKIGSYMSAMISTDNENWSYLGDPVFYNVAECYNGMYVLSAQDISASFGFFEYGAVLSGKDGYTYIPAVYSGASSYYIPGRTSSETYKYGNGEWEYTDAGYIQKSTDGNGEMYINKTYSGNYVLDGTIEMRGTGGSGIAFGQASSGDPHTTGYKVLISKGNTVTLYYNNTVLQSVTPDGLDYQNENRLKIYVDDGEIRVYVNTQLVLTYTGDIQNSGCVSYITESAQATFRNISFVEHSDLLVYNINGTGFSSTKKGIESTKDDYKAATLTFGVSDFTLNTQMTLNTSGSDVGAGISLFGELGQSALENGYSVYLKNGSIQLLKDGVVLKETTVTGLVSGVQFSLSVQVSDGVLKVGIGSNTVLEQALSDYSGGGLTFFSNSCATSFSNILLTD